MNKEHNKKGKKSPDPRDVIKFCAILDNDDKKQLLNLRSYESR